MTRKLTALTPEQAAAMGPHAAKWIVIGQRTGRLSDAEWASWEDAARRCYGFAGIPWPGVVVRVPSPLVGSFAAPIAAALIAGKQSGAVGVAVGVAVDSAVAAAVDGAVADAVRGAVRGAVDSAVAAAVGGAVRVALRGAVDGAVAVAVRGAVGSAVAAAVRGAVDSAVGDAVAAAVDSAVDDAVRGAVDSAVRGAVADAVDDAVDDAVIRDSIRRLWHRRLGGNMWCNWNAYLDYYRTHTPDIDVPAGTWDRLDAYNATTVAGWWWPHRDFVMVADRPDTLTLEQVGPSGWGSHRMHADHGPAIAWATDALYYWHGTRIPADPDDIRTWDTTRILQEPNTETRRALIEIVGWPRFIETAGLAQAGDTVPDPGNPGQTLALYDVPEQIYDAPVRVLVATNGSPERDGTRHVFGLTVPAEIDHPLAAAAWTYGLDADTYATAEARR